MLTVAGTAFAFTKFPFNELRCVHNTTKIHGKDMVILLHNCITKHKIGTFDITNFTSLKHFTLALFFLFTLSCKENKASFTPTQGTPVSIDYAQGFLITEFDDYTLLEVSRAFPNSTDTLRYALVPKINSFSSKIPENIPVVPIPLETIVVTSTTHIPSLEMLEVAETLVGFPNLDYVSSTLSRKRIANNKIKELGQNESINTEVLLELNPDAVVSFGVEGQNKSLEVVQKAGIPILYNGDWVEQDPLGKAEWIKFFGALYDKNELAESLFKQIEKDYLDTKKLVAQVSTKPTVISGAMYKDVWYLPKGDSWPARLIKDAGGKYLWADTAGTGSLSLSLESVLDKGQQATHWVAPAQYSSYDTMKKANTAYEHFDAFKNEQVYTFAAKKGETGGLLYYELAPNRPDIVLKDIVHYLHPELLPDYEPFFFSKLEK